MAKDIYLPPIIRWRVLSVTLTLQFILTANALCQLQRSTFSRVWELRTIRNPLGLVAGDFNGDGLTDIATYSSSKLLFQIQGKDSLFFQGEQSSFKGRALRMQSAYCNNDKLSDLIVINANPPEIKVYLENALHEFSGRTTIPLNDESSTFTAGDINNDRNLDIIVYGKRERGITCYTGNGSGSFKKGSLLFPETSFSSVVISDINKDGLNDILNVNWLDNTVEIYTAIGKMRFGDPLILQFSTEPLAVDVAVFDGGEAQNVVVMLANEIQTFTQSVSDGFKKNRTFPISFLPEKMMIADANSDSREDIILYSSAERNLVVYLNDENNNFKDFTSFSAGEIPIDIAVMPFYNRDTVSIAILDNAEPVIRMMFNSRIIVPPAEEILYALDNEPRGILSIDVNRDNWNDIAVTNSGSSNISILRNLGESGYSGIFSLPINMIGRTLRFGRTTGNNGFFVVMNKEEEQFAITEIQSDSFSSKSITLPVPKGSECLGVSFNKVSKFSTIFILEQDDKSKNKSLIKFAQIAPDKFVEQSVVSLFQPTAVSATMGDFDRDGDLDVVYIANNLSRELTEVYQIERNDTSGIVKQKMNFTLDLKTYPDVFLWNADVNGDGYPDLIMNFLKPLNILMVALNKDGVTFEHTVFRSKYFLNVLSKDMLKFYDVNGDKRMDIVVNNNLTKELQVFLGTGTGMFPSASRLMSSEGVGGFSFSDVNNNGLPELLVTDFNKGVLRVIPVKQ